MPKKEDLRVIKTKAGIRQAFLELCQKKPVSKITVTELAQAAMINKGTFYLHYNDIYALYLDVAKETCLGLLNLIDDYSLFLSAPDEFIRRWYTANHDHNLSEVFPHYTPVELGFQLPVFVVNEFKSRIYAANPIEQSLENEIKLDCIACDLMVAGFPHYLRDPEDTIRTMAGIIERSF